MATSYPGRVCPTKHTTVTPATQSGFFLSFCRESTQSVFSAWIVALSFSRVSSEPYMLNQKAQVDKRRLLKPLQTLGEQYHTKVSVLPDGCQTRCGPNQRNIFSFHQMIQILEPYCALSKLHLAQILFVSYSYPIRNPEQRNKERSLFSYTI
jgi:hypothetical protein